MEQKLPKAILFDLDDTILAYEAVAEKCWREACQTFAPRVPGLEPDRLLAAIKESLDWFWDDPERNRRGRLNLGVARREIVSAAFTSIEVAAPAVSDEIADYFTEIREEAVEPIPGAIETVQRLRNHGLKLALITNGAARPQRSKLERFGLAPLFDSILVEGEFGAGKPDDRVYLHSLERLGILPHEAWMVGDNLEFDVGAPQGLGIFSIWVDWRFDGLGEGSPVKPDRIVNRIAELVERLSARQRHAGYRGT